MTFENVLSLLGIVLSSGLIVELFKWWVGKSSSKGKAKREREEKLDHFLDRFEKMESSLDININELQMSQMRTNLMLLLDNHPNNPEIPKIGEEYVKRGGNSYIIPLLMEWYADKEMDCPDWLIKAKKERELED